MEHPLIYKVDDLTIDELQNKISDLTKKLQWASRTNADLARQISMALENFRNAYARKQQELLDKTNRNVDDYTDRINIS